MHPKGWLDSEKFQRWVREVLAVYLNGQYGYLLQDQLTVHLKYLHHFSLESYNVARHNMAMSAHM
jgi:hypothetical protein